jgi:hypothetical protein
MRVTELEKPSPDRPRAQARARPRARLAALLCLTMLVVACGSGGSDGSGPMAGKLAQSPARPSPAAGSAAGSGAGSAAASLAAPDQPATPNLLAAGMCRGTQLHAAITFWEGNTGSPVAHVAATNVSPAICDMRGVADAQIVDGNGLIIADPGAGSASATPVDPVLTLLPGESARTTVTWSNYCVMSMPVQNVTVAFVLPLGLGRVVATTTVRAQVPDCQGTASSPLRVAIQPRGP